MWRSSFSATCAVDPTPELCGMCVALRLHQRQLAHPQIALPEPDTSAARQLSEPHHGPIQELAVDWKVMALGCMPTRPRQRVIEERSWGSSCLKSSSPVKYW
jgi:hypothetical protein